MTPDLPLELWMEVLSYLPPGYIRRLLPINRQLFHLAMEDKYEKLEVISADLRTLERIRCNNPFVIFENICLPLHGRSPIGLQYVRRLEIRSSPHPYDNSRFLSPLGCRTNQSTEPTTLIQALRDALLHCARLEEVTLYLYDLEWKPAFSSLMSALLSQKGGSLQKLYIDADLFGISGWLRFFSAQSSSLPHLVYLSLKLKITQLRDAQSRFSGLRVGNRTGSGIAAFIKAHKRSLRTLVLHLHPQFTLVDTSSLFDIGRLPHLKKLELSVSIAKVSRLEVLELFLLLNGNTLEYFNLKFMRSILHSTLQFDSAYQIILDDVLPNLHFPVLSEFSMDIYNKTTMPFHLPPFAISLRA
ncbi:hypothetical protein AGABI1DRAFT_131451 [Agaricus bisporus var. burnettii JB137-S8]|uniref:F-box domain-containing protein n=1 Tax=Agaricus bisporus var. burnettii (strain JB137-S8 / ATCC MYA-4627 / FGSC 10392) TaxID=597362 RepID=K5WM21_AGABU|nr:uncharacterized protein AGABI1DRAFT_131451 [Agaricus bisporus var. burnettii JB137-S8]EKM76366.1 hypothetical protein AGABI1DRAFT_131451 [Agaricus bisporus var. burnettii JB137-S8]